MSFCHKLKGSNWIYLQTDSVDLWYVKLTLFDLAYRLKGLWHRVANNFHLIPPGYFHWKILWKSTKAKKNPQNPQALGLIIESLNPLFKKECHLLSDKLETMEILTPRDSMINPRACKWYIVHSSSLHIPVYRAEFQPPRESYIVRIHTVEGKTG